MSDLNVWIEHAAQLQSKLELCREALKIAAKAEMYDPETGIIDADVLEIVQIEARAALAASEDA